MTTMSSTLDPIGGLNVSEALFNVTGIWNVTDPVNTTAGMVEAEGPGVRDFMEFKVALYINRVYLWVVFGVAVPGNIAAILTLAKMKPFTSSNMYMCVLAVFDLLTIILKLAYVKLTTVDIVLTDAGCQFFTGVGTFCMHFANWVLVAMTVERFIAIWFPLRLVDFCTVRRAIGVLVIIGVVLFALNSHFFWTYFEGWDEIYHYSCMIKDEFAEFEASAWYWIDGAIYSFIPTINLIVFNSLIIMGIQKSGRRQRRLTNKVDKTQMTDKQRQQRQVTTMLIAVSVVFVFLTTPNCVFFILEHKWDYTASAHQYAIYLLVQQSVYMLSDSNHAVNFFLYFLSGQKFRRCFLELVCFCRKKKSLRSRVTMSNIHSTSNVRTSNATSVSTVSTDYCHDVA